MAVHSVREKDNFAHIHKVCGHMSVKHILWHRTNSKNANFTDADVARARPICQACAYGESRQMGTDQHRIHRPMPSRAGDVFVMDAFSCSVQSVRGFKYCDLLRDAASQMIYPNFTKSRQTVEILAALKNTFLLNPEWTHATRPLLDIPNSRYVRLDPEAAYKSQSMLEFWSDRNYRIEFTAPRDKHAGGIAERMVGLVVSKTNTAMLVKNVPPKYWCWAMLKVTQDLNFNYCEKIGTSPYNFVTHHHVDIKYLHEFFAECYMFIPLAERKGKLPYRRAQRCKLLCYSYTTILVPRYVVMPIDDKGHYGTPRISKDIIFDETCVFDLNIDNSPLDTEFADIPNIIENLVPGPVEPPLVEAAVPAVPHPLKLMSPGEYLERGVGERQEEEQPVGEFPLIVINEDEYQPSIDENGRIQYWNTVTHEMSGVPVINYNKINHYIMTAMNYMAASPNLPVKFIDAFSQEKWKGPIEKELMNFITNNCFQWITDVGQRRLHMKWLFSVKADTTLKARLVARGDRCKAGIDYDPDEVYCGNVTASSIKVFFAMSALYGLKLRGGDLVGAYLVTPGSKDFPLCMATPDGFEAPPGMVLNVLGNLYGLPSSGRNFSKAVDSIVIGLGYTNTPYDPKFFIKWIDGRPILLMFHSDDFRWSGSTEHFDMWTKLVKAFEDAGYKVKDCTTEPFVGINVTSDSEGNYYLDQKKAIEGAVKTAKIKLGGAKLDRLPYLLTGESLSKADNAKDEEEAKEVSKTPYRTLIGILSYIAGHTKPDIQYAQNVLSRYCNNPGKRHVEFLMCLIRYCEYSKNDRLKYYGHKGPYDVETMKSLIQLRYQCDADLAGNLDNLHSTSSHIGYIGVNNIVSFSSKTQGSLSTSTAESEIKAVNQCLKEEAIAMRGMLILMGFPQDTTIIEEDNQACVYASEVPHLTRGMKHLDLAEMFIKEKVENKEIKLLKVASGDNTSDLGTKRLALPLFNKLTSRIIDKALRTNL